MTANENGYVPRAGLDFLVRSIDISLAFSLLVPPRMPWIGYRSTRQMVVQRMHRETGDREEASAEEIGQEGEMSSCAKSQVFVLRDFEGDYWPML